MELPIKDNQPDQGTDSRVFVTVLSDVKLLGQDIESFLKRLQAIQRGQDVSGIAEARSEPRSEESPSHQVLVDSAALLHEAEALRWRVNVLESEINRHSEGQTSLLSEAKATLLKLYQRLVKLKACTEQPEDKLPALATQLATSLEPLLNRKEIQAAQEEGHPSIRDLQNSNRERYQEVQSLKGDLYKAQKITKFLIATIITMALVYMFVNMGSSTPVDLGHTLPSVNAEHVEEQNSLDEVLPMQTALTVSAASDIDEIAVEEDSLAQLSITSTGKPLSLDQQCLVDDLFFYADRCYLTLPPVKPERSEEMNSLDEVLPMQTALTVSAASDIDEIAVERDSLAQLSLTIESTGKPLSLDQQCLIDELVYFAYRCYLNETFVAKDVRSLEATEAISKAVSPRKQQIKRHLLSGLDNGTCCNDCSIWSTFRSLLSC